MAFPSEINYSPATPHCPSPWPSTAQHLRIPNLCIPNLRFHLLFHHNYPHTMQYNWLESETQCALMHSVLNSLRDRLWFNRLKDTETWSWNVMLWITYLSSSLSSLYTTLLTSPPPSPPLLLSPLKRNIALKSCSCTFYSMRIFLNLTANIMILGTYTHFS